MAANWVTIDTNHHGWQFINYTEGFCESINVLFELSCIDSPFAKKLVYTFERQGEIDFIPHSSHRSSEQSSARKVEQFMTVLSISSNLKSSSVVNCRITFFSDTLKIEFSSVFMHTLSCFKLVTPTRGLI